MKAKLVCESLEEIYNINEKIIQPIETKHIIREIFNMSPNIDIINDNIKKYKIKIVSYDEAINTIKNQKEKDQAPPRNFYLIKSYGIQFGFYNNDEKIVFIVVNKELFINGLIKHQNNEKGYENINDIVNLLSEMTRHETIHLQQFNRRPQSAYKDPVSWTDPVKYWNNQDEIMAYARSFVDTCIYSYDMSIEEILQLIRTKKLWELDWVAKEGFNKAVTKKNKNKFLKYVFDYVNTFLK